MDKKSKFRIEIFEPSKDVWVDLNKILILILGEDQETEYYSTRKEAEEKIELMQENCLTCRLRITEFVSNII